MRWIFGARKRSAGRVAARRNQLGLGSFAGRPRRLAHEFLEDRRMLAVFVVTGTGDADLAGSPTANPVAGQTDTYDLPSLRAAVDAVNGLGGDNTIQFAPSLSGITLSNGQLELSDLTGTTTIAGPGASQLTVSGNYTTTVFQVDGGVTANISGLTIADGYAEYGYGGGVYNAGTLTLSNSILSGNSVAGAYGGGIYNDGTLTLGNSTLSENSNAGGYGGGICNDGGATITNSTLSA